MPILFYTAGESLVSNNESCGSEPREWKSISLNDLEAHFERFKVRSTASDVPSDLRGKLIAACKFPIAEVEMLIKQNAGAKYLFIFYGIDNEKHFHYMITADEDKRNLQHENSIILEDCCRVPPNNGFKLV
jgi:hypothetical protein